MPKLNEKGYLTYCECDWYPLHIRIYDQLDFWRRETKIIEKYVSFVKDNIYRDQDVSFCGLVDGESVPPANIIRCKWKDWVPIIKKVFYQNSISHMAHIYLLFGVPMSGTGEIMEVMGYVATYLFHMRHLIRNDCFGPGYLVF